MRIIRFLCDGKPHVGEYVDDKSARLIVGSLCGEHRVTDDVLAIEQLLAPIVPTDILCIGLNYRAHAAETGAEVPANPMLFIKSSNALANPGDTISLPGNSTRVDYEGELVVVIGKDCKNVSRDRALQYVFGYTVGNDVSARDWQKRPDLNGGQFARGKSFDSFAPIGPWIVTPDELTRTDHLNIQTRVSGEILQDSNTADMIFDVPAIIEFLSASKTLLPGTVILTGTPHGVGFARTPPVWLKPGDSVSIEIEKIGTLTNPVIAEPV